MMTQETLANCFKSSSFIDFDYDKAIMVDNAEWLLELNYVQFF